MHGTCNIKFKKVYHSIMRKVYNILTDWYAQDASQDK
jgi:hypothetical protein